VTNLKSVKSYGLTLVLTLFLGFAGAHRFYAGKVWTGFAYLFTLGWLGIGWVIDILTVLFGNFTDKTGQFVRPKSAEESSGNRMDDSSSPTKGLPVWVWLVGGVLVLAVFGSFLGGGADDSTAPAENTEVATPPADEAPEVDASDSADADFAIATVRDRYEADCFAYIGEDPQYRYEADTGGTMREGFVFVSVGGEVLQFGVGINDTSGNFLTTPFNEYTVELLWDKCVDDSSEPVPAE
jgi:TM2 domain-containing membrane protein YozV